MRRQSLPPPAGGAGDRAPPPNLVNPETINIPTNGGTWGDRGYIGHGGEIFRDGNYLIRYTGTPGQRTALIKMHGIGNSWWDLRDARPSQAATTSRVSIYGNEGHQYIEGGQTGGGGFADDAFQGQGPTDPSRYRGDITIVRHKIHPLRGTNRRFQGADVFH